jgi:tRNA threonylcarbamoyladenosine modification (KEOPS) complex Cgi121 subunit
VESNAKSMYVMMVATSRPSIDELLQMLPGSKGVLQLFDERAIACREHLGFAYLNAVKMQERKESRSKSIAMEMMLCAAMTSQIEDAISKVGVKQGRSFIVFSDSSEAYARIAKYLVNPVEFNPGKKVPERIIALGIKSGKVEDLIQEIALKAMER